MPDAWQFVGELIRSNPYLICFVLLLVEEGGLPLPLPGDLVALYVATYDVELGITYPNFLLLAVSASTIGSLLLYTLSYRFGETLLLRFGRFVRIKPRHLEHARALAQRRGVLSLLLLRLVPGLRIAVSVVAGTLHVPLPLFLLANTLSALVWWSFWWWVGSTFGDRAVAFLAQIPLGAGLLLAILFVLLLILRVRFTHLQH